MRLKFKMYTRPADDKQFVVSHKLLFSERALVFLTSDDETDEVFMTIDDYNAIPYHWFEEQGPAPTASAVTPVPL